jgi:hypothetical protein
VFAIGQFQFLAIQKNEKNEKCEAYQDPFVTIVCARLIFHMLVRAIEIATDYQRPRKLNKRGKRRKEDRLTQSNPKRTEIEELT